MGKDAGQTWLELGEESMNDTAIETNADLATEDLVAVNVAGKKFKPPVSRTSLERWMRTGVRGIRLESIQIGHRRFVSIQAIERFIQRTNQPIDTNGHTRRTPAELEMKKREFFGQ